jgi:RNA polymerase sigma-70 factor (ECF subfamily)
MWLMIATTTPHDRWSAMSEIETPLRVQGDFDAFVRSTYPGLLGVATALTGTVHDAQDMVQDTMLKAFVRWDRLRAYEQPQGWAHRVLVNRCVGWWRRRRTEAAFFASLRRQEPTTAGPSPVALAFWQAVRHLPARHQQVVALYYAADLTVDEVAGVLAVPSGTVRSDLTRARAALATLLED